MADFATWDRKTLEAFAADALERISHQGNQLAKLRPRLDECAPYLKEGETPLQRIERDAKDTEALMTLLAAEKRKNEAMIRGEFICPKCWLRQDAGSDRHERFGSKAPADPEF